MAKKKKNGKAKKLTTKERRFAELYDGNGTKAAKDAGYKGDTNTLNQVAIANLHKPMIFKIIQARETKLLDGITADKGIRQKFWAKIMKDAGNNLRDRLRSSELLGKSCGDFIDVTADSKTALEDILSESNKPTKGK